MMKSRRKSIGSVFEAKKLNSGNGWFSFLLARALPKTRATRIKVIKLHTQPQNSMNRELPSVHNPHFTKV